MDTEMIPIVFIQTYPMTGIYA